MAENFPRPEYPAGGSARLAPPRPANPATANLPALLVILLLVASVWLGPRFAENIEFALTRGRERAEVEVARGQLESGGLPAFAQVFEQVAKSIGPSVVHIDTVKEINYEQSGFGSRFGLGGQGSYSQEQGSGVIIDHEGYILTNLHVVDGAKELTVSLSDGREVDADVVGSDPSTDLAVIKIDAEGLTPAPWGDSDKLPVGAPVWAVGNPYGLDRSVTFGIISAKSRRGLSGNPYQDFLQTDAAVNPGNSGGPLVNVRGEVVGINTAIIGKSYQGISFAIPSETVHQVYDQLRANKRVIRGYLGVQLDEEISPQLAHKLQLKDTHGALVKDIVPEGPAATAGIEPGDVIVQWNDQPIDSPTTLRLLIARTPVGSQAQCVLVHEGERVTKTVRVGEMPSQPRVRTRQRQGRGLP